MSAHGRNHWIKLYVEMLDDPKVGLLPDAVKWRWVSVLLQAGELNEDGFLPDVNDMAWRLHTNVETLQGEMRTLAGRGLVELRAYTDGSERWFIPAFEKRQRAATSTERSQMRRHRERQNSGGNNETTGVQRNVAKKLHKQNTETETETEGNARAGQGAENPPTDLPSDFLENPPEHLTPAQVAAVVSERQNSEDPYVVVENYINARIPGIPDEKSKDYDRDWRMPILNMLVLADNDIDLTKRLIDAALIEARKPKKRDAKPYAIVRPFGLLPFFKTQIENHRAAESPALTDEDEAVWQQAIATVSSGRPPEDNPPLLHAIKTVGWNAIAEADKFTESRLKRQLFNAYRSAPA